jgi:hypothetical protein
MRVWKILLPLALLLTFVQLWRGHALSWDEIEFFRATWWIGEGRVPFRDFWEHHLPLQWIVFAPLARWFANGSGVEAVLALRIAQLPLWIATFAMLMAIARRQVDDRASRWSALVLLLAAPLFTNAALEYRVDALGNFAFIAALALVVLRAQSRWNWIGFGALMSIAVLANMRMAPLVAFTGALMLFWDAAERRWRWSPQSLWMAAGIAPVVAIFVSWLFAVHAWPAFVTDVIALNRSVDATMSDLVRGSLAWTLLAPLRDRDVACIAIWLLGIAGCARALREIRRPGPLQLFAILTIASVLSVAFLHVQYPYHLQNAYLLLLPLAALGLSDLARRVRLVPALTAAIVVVALLIHAAPMLRDDFGAPMLYEDRIMEEVDRRTTKDEVVWDGVGYALRREPAYRYWFLPTGVRLLVRAGKLPAYSARELATNPPAAILYGLRVQPWLDEFPDTAAWSFRHYVPLYRDLWIPGLGSRIEPRPMKVAWLAPKAGRYEIFASELLARHPWLTRPQEYLLMQGTTLEGMQIPLRSLPPMSDDAFQWTVDGQPIAPGTRILTLRKGSRVELVVDSPVAAGVLVVPEGTDTLCLPAPDRFIL